MSESLCVATLQLLDALVRTGDCAVVDGLLPAPAQLPQRSLEKSGEDWPSASPESLARHFDGLADPRSLADFSAALLAAQRQQRTLDTATPLALDLPAISTLTAAAASHRTIARASVQLSSGSLTADDRALFSVVLLNKMDGWHSSQLATTLALSSLLQALAVDRRPHVQLFVMGRHAPAAAAAVAVAGRGAGERSVIECVHGLWRSGRRREQRIANLPQRLAACKAAMSDSAPLPTAARAHSASPASPAAASAGVVSGVSGPADSAEVQCFLRAWLTLEALVVELCAAQYSQHTQPVAV